MRVQITLEDNENGTVNINVAALDGAEFTQPESGQEPTSAEQMAAAFLHMIKAQEEQHKRMVQEAGKRAIKNAVKKKPNDRIVVAKKPGLVDGNGNPVSSGVKANRQKE